VEYVHSFKQDTPFFRGLSKKKILGSHCKKCHYKYATPRAQCMYCGGETEWFDSGRRASIHGRCYFCGRRVLKDVPFTLILVEFKGVNTVSFT
jgi:uncharacterized OB-fold protein